MLRSMPKHANVQTLAHGRRSDGPSTFLVRGRGRSPSQASLPSPPPASKARRAPAKEARKRLRSGSIALPRCNSASRRPAWAQHSGIMEEALDDWFRKHALNRLRAPGKAA
jgi:hypothetical protein